MPSPLPKHRLSDLGLVEHAQQLADSQSRNLRRVVDDDRRDAEVYEDRNSGERTSVPRKFIRAIGLPAAFELVTLDPTDLIP